MSSAPPARSRATLAFEWFITNWSPFATFAGSLLLAIAGAPALFQPEDPKHPSTSTFMLGHWGGPQWLFVLGSALAFAGVFRQASRRPTYSTLLAERDYSRSLARDRASAMEAILRAIVNGLTESLDLVAHTNRASVYCFEDSQFVLLSRVSLNSDWKKPGRVSYSEGQGVIGQAWRETSSAVVDLPSLRSEWEVEVIDLGIPADVVSTLRMQSRSLIGMRIDAHHGFESIPVGVLVIESTTPRGVNYRTIDRLKTEVTWHLLEHAMANARDHLPVVARALLHQPA